MKTNTKIIEAGVGEHITTFADKLVKKRQSIINHKIDKSSNSEQDLTATFNGAIITVTLLSTPESVVEDFYAEMDKQSKAYVESDEYKQQQAKQEIEATKGVTKWNDLMVKLPKINFNDHNKGLDWLNNYCEVIDFIPALDKEPKMEKSMKIVADAFIAGGYEINANAGDKFKKDNEENFARYLIGQVLIFLSRSSAVPPIFGSMYSDYKKQFKLVDSEN